MASESTIDFLIKNVNLKKSIDILKTGERYIKITNGDIILMLGITGSGKSTLVQFLTNDSQNLTATQDQESNDLLISDNNQHIGTPTTISKTLLPELIIDRHAHKYIYDCPGFSDTRSAATDMASTYFIKKLLDNAVRVKLIFLVNYPAVRKGVDRHRFMELLKHITSLVKNATKYKDGIALIVTKVDNTVYRGKNNTYVNVSDMKKKETIVNFLLETKDTLTGFLNNDTYTIRQREFFRSSIQFIDIVMAKQNEDYVKLGLFKRPSQIGPINDDPILQANKKILRKLIFDDTKYVNSNRNDFGYTISEKTLYHINEIVAEINEEIFTNYKRISQAVNEHLNKNIIATSSFHELLIKLQDDSNAWDQMLTDLKYIQNPVNFLKRVTDTLNQQHIEIDSTILEDILNEISYIDYLKLITTKQVIMTRYKWFAPLKWNLKQIRGWIDWFYLIFEIDDALSKYDFQKNIDNIKFTNEWGLIKSSTQGLYLEHGNFQKFLKKFQSYSDKDFHLIEDDNSIYLKIECLNSILKFITVKTRQTTCSSDGILTVMDRIVILSDVVKYLNLCSKLIQIEIYASQKIIIDQNVDFNNYTLIFVAPNWDVIGAVTINLNGGKFLGIVNKYPHSNLLSINQTSGIVHLYELQRQISILTPLNSIQIENTFNHQIPHIVENYKYYLRENIEDKTKRSLILKFLNDLEINIVKLKEYNILWFVLDFQKLEDQFDRLQYDSEALSFYRALFQRVIDYSDKYFKTSTLEEQKVLIFLCTAIQSKMMLLKNIKETNLIIDLDSYIKSVIDDIKNLDKLESIVLINKKNDLYKNEIDLKIKDVKKFLEDTIQDEINDTIEEFTNEIKRLIKEISQLEKDLEKNKEELIKHRQELVEKMKNRAIVGIFSLLGKIASFFGPIGETVGTFIGIGTQIAESVAVNPQTAPRATPKMIDGLNEATSAAASIDKYSIIDRRKTNFNSELDKLANEANQHLDENSAKEINNLIEKTKQKIKDSTQGVSGRKSVSIFKKLKKEFKEKLEEKRKELDIVPSKWDRIRSVYTKSSNYINQASAVAEMSLTVYDNYKHDSEEIEQVTRAINETDLNIAQLKHYNNQIETIFIPMVHNIGGHIKNFQHEIEVQNKFQMDISKWEMGGNLKKVKSFIKDFIKSNSADIPSNMLQLADKLEGIMDLLINIFKQIENYQEHKQFTDYVTEMNTIASKHKGITDSKLKKALDNLSYTIQSNVILNEYRKTMQHYYQWVFPFPFQFIEYSDLAPSFKIEESSTHFIYIITEKLTKLERKLDEYKNSIFSTMDPYIHTGKVSHELESTESFYVWDNDHYNSLIGKLLAGHEISLLANVKKSNPNKNAIKFNRIRLDFVAVSNLTELHNELKKFTISLTHMGNSHYRCNDKFYTISSPSQTISYTYEMEQGEPVNSNEVYKKLERGNFLLSPYALWKIKLLPTRNHTFSELKRYKHLVSLYLNGYGRYVDNEKEALCKNLHKYYEIMDTESKQEIVSDMVNLAVARQLELEKDDEDDEDVGDDEDVKEGEEFEEVNKIHEISNTPHKRTIRCVIEGYPDVKCAASLSESPINNLFKWMKKSWQQVTGSISELFETTNNWYFNTKNFNLIPNSLPDHSTTNPIFNNFYLWPNINSTLLLTNYALRLFTREKFENILSTINKSLSIDDAQVLAMNLTDQLEKLIVDVNDDNVQLHNFDFVNIQNQIFKSLMTENFQEIDRIFTNSIKTASNHCQI